MIIINVFLLCLLAFIKLKLVSTRGAIGKFCEWFSKKKMGPLYVCVGGEKWSPDHFFILF